MPAVSVGQEDNIDIEINYEVHGSGQPGVLIDGYPLTTSWCWPGRSPAHRLRVACCRSPASRTSGTCPAVVPIRLSGPLAEWAPGPDLDVSVRSIRRRSSAPC